MVAGEPPGVGFIDTGPCVAVANVPDDVVRTTSGQKISAYDKTDAQEELTSECMRMNGKAKGRANEKVARIQGRLNVQARGVLLGRVPGLGPEER